MPPETRRKFPQRNMHNFGSAFIGKILSHLSEKHEKRREGWDGMSRQLFICVARGKRGATRRQRRRRMADRPTDSRGSICRSDLARSLALLSILFFNRKFVTERRQEKGGIERGGRDGPLQQTGHPRPTDTKSELAKGGGAHHHGDEGSGRGSDQGGK